jgi:hypothetical protein
VKYGSEELKRAMMAAKVKDSARAEALSLGQSASLFLALNHDRVLSG